MNPQAPIVRQRPRSFLAVIGYGALAVSLAFVAMHARARPTASPPPNEAVRQKGSVVRSAHPAVFSAMGRAPHVAFRNLQQGAGFGTLAYASLADPGQSRETTDLTCARIYQDRGMTICLAGGRGRRFPVYLLDDCLVIQQVLMAVGVPSRARLSHDGRLAVYTSFMHADSYMASGFSTRTRLVDVASGTVLDDLEAFTVWQDDHQVQSPDFNFWGVTFAADSSQFFATLRTRGHTYLVKGDVPAKRVTIVHDGIECPSLSQMGLGWPSSRRYHANTWRPAILDLSSGTVHTLGETRNVDDQLEWLDNDHVLYAVHTTRPETRTDIWRMAVNGESAPGLFLADAESPAVVP